MTERSDGFLNGDTPTIETVEAKGGPYDGLPLVMVESEQVGIRLVFDVQSAIAMMEGFSMAIDRIREHYPHLFSQENSDDDESEQEAA